MKLIRKYIEKDSSGYIKLIPEDSEDMWHLYNLILKGDRINASTIRGIKSETATGSVSSERVRTRLTILVEEVFFDVQVGVLRINGKSTQQNKYVQIGQYHTLDLEVNQPFEIYKPDWDFVSLQRVSEICDVAKKADVAAVVMQEGLANLCLITQYMTIVKQRIQVPIPRKRFGSSTLHEKGFSNFFQKVYTAIKQHIDFSFIKVFIIASPGFLREEFVEYFNSAALRNEDKQIIENKSKIVLIHTSSGHKSALEEVLRDPVIVAKLATTKYALEVSTLDKFYKMMNSDPNRAVYGYKHVLKAADMGAIGTLLIADTLFRSPDISKRKTYVNLVQSLSKTRSTVVIFSSLHVSGEQLNQLTGVAAILNFPIPDLDEDFSADSE
ncbi:hypothetical protein BB560_002232 [Smittium megazygosporum]|uniref:Protein DOM34 homolog n=1 Tax=Smittium megazygosporum TaxID=133381 RepID=A0A2T9XZX1_9FUNG|nr:hypothetical protein BB560_006959 [Smittium megazygosporum]PVV03298.1 hypothetical protein BB560_002232 [Smittium megazygosporum]